MPSETIITQTLPTIVGMGVVSRTTDTMFRKGSKSRQRASASNHSSSSKRKFGSKTYKAANWHTTKAIAESDAGHFRKQGHLARVVKEYNSRLKRWGYMVYVA